MKMQSIIIMWYSYYDETVTEDKINMDIDKNIKDIVGDEKYDYVWYINPKMTVPEVFHAQVFWIAIKTK